jgi:RNA polymerase sigma-70 factor (sigma-E family)
VGISPDAHVPGSKAEDAFEEFVRGRSTHLFRLALVLTGWDRAAAEDVLQIALERAYRRRRLLFREGSAEPYVRRVVVNAAIDWRRMLRRRAEQPLDLAAGLAAGDRTGLVADRDVLVRALAALAPKQRAVLVLRYWEDVPDAEIAAMLNCSPGTVRSQASRALTRLRELSRDPSAAPSD